MSTEDQEILAKISQLAGQINRHKNGQSSGQHTQPAPTSSARSCADTPQSSAEWRSSRGGYLSRGYGRGSRAQLHRNRTLVLNSNASTPPNTTAADSSGENSETASSNRTATQGWVTKTDRHLQLINASIFEKDSQTRAKAMEETRKQKLKKRDERERARFNKHLYRMRGNSNNTSGVHLRSTDSAENYEISVQGIRFRVAKNGSKLVKVPGDLNAAKATPKAALVGGVRFYRSKNGNLFRSGIVKAHRTTGDVKKIDEPCKKFTTTGSCSKGPRCRYVHDPSKVAACREFLLKGSCPSGDSCDLSHDLIPERTPACLHFVKGNCANPNCRYAHVRVSPSAPVCRAFGLYGYCEKGASCDQRHANECPDFSNTGTCTTKGCKLPHRHKASVMRTNALHVEDESSDISSDDDDDDEIGSDDVDSDDFEEFIGDDEPIPMQEDFVQLR
ncbi:hypothetical protein OIDMADRAFT_182012 [Oidiodendron maius Zn]|uniref:C3H1-type domain-containing protein n=1 Tax=Oidiodendron maius (strain Zn) TaxID=913774 RepID=A0A0C3CFD0_OIDMZ|nr:hypothetical protein OIDMADRAFT_182012 [Oidiodendron maius Zn]